MKRILLVLSLAALAALPAGTASAITYGSPDNGAHPWVGALVVADSDGTKDWICSGTLISPTVFLTASHCTIGEDRVWVTFDDTFSAGSTLYPGTAHTNPAYSQKASDPGDVAVVTLDSSPPVAPASLPTAGLLDRLKKSGALKTQSFTVVGYGAFGRQNGGGPPTFPGGGTRYAGTGTLNSLTNAWLHLSGNPATGNSGTCYGDSGGPNFLGTSKVVAGLTVTGDTPCRSTNVDYRVDTASARSFLGQYVALP